MAVAETSATSLTDERPVLVATSALGPDLGASAAVAAIARGLERAGMRPPDRCPLADGGPGTADVLLLALGGETHDGYVLVEDGGAAVVDLGDPGATGERIALAAGHGCDVVFLAAAGDETAATAPATLDALARHGGLGATRLVVLRRGPVRATTDPWAADGAEVVAAAAFVLDTLGTDRRMRAARAVVVGEEVLDDGTLAGRAAGELATRARQAGVPCHAVAARAPLDRFGRRIIDLQTVHLASTTRELEAAGEAIGSQL